MEHHYDDAGQRQAAPHTHTHLIRSSNRTKNTPPPLTVHSRVCFFLLLFPSSSSSFPFFVSNLFQQFADVKGGRHDALPHPPPPFSVLFGACCVSSFFLSFSLSQRQRIDDDIHRHRIESCRCVCVDISPLLHPTHTKEKGEREEGGQRTRRRLRRRRRRRRSGTRRPLVACFIPPFSSPPPLSLLSF